jgi:hypothetical protein
VLGHEVASERANENPGAAVVRAIREGPLSLERRDKVEGSFGRSPELPLPLSLKGKGNCSAPTITPAP